MKKLRLSLIGFGNAGREFARILLEKGDKLSKEFDCEFEVVSITTKSKGCLVDENGIDIKRALDELESIGKFSKDNPALSNLNSMQVIEKVAADVVVEITTLNIETGQPAIDHIKAALNSGKHVITTNKGPIAWAFEELCALAKNKNKLFLFEGTVLDGAPVFNLVRETLLGCEVTEFRGILNGTTNYLLTELEKGTDYDEALKKAQKMGWAEADPTMDVDGWDPVAKTTALLNVLMHANVTPNEIKRKSIKDISKDDLKKARKQGKTIKYICEGYKEDGKFYGRVEPQLINLDDILAITKGTTSVVTIVTDFLHELTIQIKDPEIRQTSYAIVTDMLNIARIL